MVYEMEQITLLILSIEIVETDNDEISESTVHC